MMRRSAMSGIPHIYVLLLPRTLPLGVFICARIWKLFPISFPLDDHVGPLARCRPWAGERYRGCYYIFLVGWSWSLVVSAVSSSRMPVPVTLHPQADVYTQFKGFGFNTCHSVGMRGVFFPQVLIPGLFGAGRSFSLVTGQSMNGLSSNDSSAFLPS